MTAHPVPLAREIAADLGRMGLRGRNSPGSSQRRAVRARRWLLLACSAGLAACQSSQSDADLVRYRASPQIGTWHPELAGSGAAAGASRSPGADAGSFGGAAGAAASAGSAAIDAPADEASESAHAGVAARGGAPAPSTGAGAGAPAVPATAGASGAPSVAEGPTSMTFEVLTVRQGGKYAPKNVGAIWIADASGNFVKTLEVWARERRRELYRFNADTGANLADAVTSATLRSHVVHRVTWDLTDVSGNPVDAGTYRVVIEVTDRESPGATAEIEFASDAAATLMPADQTYYQAMRLTVQ